jgi:hypothetical protein
MQHQRMCCVLCRTWQRWMQVYLLFLVLLPGLSTTDAGLCEPFVRLPEIDPTVPWLLMKTQMEVKTFLLIQIADKIAQTSEKQAFEEVKASYKSW